MYQVYIYIYKRPKKIAKRKGTWKALSVRHKWYECTITATSFRRIRQTLKHVSTLSSFVASVNEARNSRCN